MSWDSSLAGAHKVVDTIQANERPRYKDLKPDIDRQKHLDSLLFARFPQHNRIEVATGFIGPPFGSGVSREFWRIAATHLVTAREGNVLYATVGFSKTAKVEEIGSTNMVDILAGSERPLVANLYGHVRLGLKCLYPTDIFGDEFVFPAVMLATEWGLSWKWDRWDLFVEGSLPRCGRRCAGFPIPKRDASWLKRNRCSCRAEPEADNSGGCLAGKPGRRSDPDWRELSTGFLMAARASGRAEQRKAAAGKTPGRLCPGIGGVRGRAHRLESSDRLMSRPRR